MSINITVGLKKYKGRFEENIKYIIFYFINEINTIVACSVTINNEPLLYLLLLTS